MLAIRNVHYEKGSLLEYNNVFLTEGESDAQAYNDAQMRFSHRKGMMNYVVKNPSIAQAQPQLIQQGEFFDGNSGESVAPFTPVNSGGEVVPTPAIIQEIAPIDSVPVPNIVPQTEVPQPNVTPIPLNEQTPMGVPLGNSGVQDQTPIAANTQTPLPVNGPMNSAPAKKGTVEDVQVNGSALIQTANNQEPNPATNIVQASGTVPFAMNPQGIASDRKPMNTETKDSGTVNWSYIKPQTGGWVGDLPPDTVVTPLNDIAIRQAKTQPTKKR